MNYINTPPNPTSNNILAIADSGAGNDIKSRLTYGSKMESSYILTLQILVISKQESQIHIFPKIQTAPLISLGVLCDDVCTITRQTRNVNPEE